MDKKNCLKGVFFIFAVLSFALGVVFAFSNVNGNDGAILFSIAGMLGGMTFMIMCLLLFYETLE